MPRWLFTLIVVCLCGAAAAQPEPAGRREASCALCSVNLKFGFDFLVGVGIIVALLWVIYWVETATSAAIAEHVFGLSITCVVMYFFLRFLWG